MKQAGVAIAGAGLAYLLKDATIFYWSLDELKAIADKDGCICPLTEFKYIKDVVSSRD